MNMPLFILNTIVLYLILISRRIQTVADRDDGMAGTSLGTLAMKSYPTPGGGVLR